jgi:hypothetical protein
MRTFSIRLDEELFEKLESVRGTKTRADYIREVLIAHFSEPQITSKEPQSNLGEPQQDSLVQSLQSEISYLRSKLDDMTKLLSQEQALHLQTQKLLPESEYAKKWWQFWK